MHRGWIVVFTLSLSLPGLCLADEEPAPWAEELRLAVFGGPSAGLLDLRLNGEFLAEFDVDPIPSSRIADLVRPGVNELTITAKAAAPREAGEMRISVNPIRNVSRHQRQIEHPLVSITVPGELEPGFDCAQTVRFWAGPVPEAPEAQALKERYWLVVDGPPARHWVSVEINGHVVFEASEGTAIVEVTDHVIKGKNSVEYLARPGCFQRESARPGDLEFFVTTGVERVDVIDMTGVPMAPFRIAPASKKDEISRTLSFRGR